MTLPILCSMCGHANPLDYSQDDFSVCSTCSRQKDYSTPNATRVGRRMGASFSVEFELSFTSHREAQKGLALLKYGYIRTIDRSCGDEYKSPIYQSAAVFSRHLPTLHSLREYVSSECGTHIHVELKNKAFWFDSMEALFGPLLEYMIMHSKETTAFWGRDFCNYAKNHFDGKYSAFNLFGAKPTLEFRLPHFVSGAQYYAVMQFSRAATTFLNTKETSMLDANDVYPIGKELLHLYKRHLAAPVQLPPHSRKEMLLHV